MTAFGSRDSQPERPALGDSGMADMGRKAERLLSRQRHW